MCGINGIALSTRSGRRLDQDTVVRMRDVIKHRGPDEAGIFVDARVGLGHRRLSIVDVAAGHQPMTNEDDSLQITYNGEIYNHADYREELEARATSTAHTATPKQSCIFTKNMAHDVSTTCEACSRSQSGTSGSRSCS